MFQWPLTLYGFSVEYHALISRELEDSIKLSYFENLTAWQDWATK